MESPTLEPHAKVYLEPAGEGASAERLAGRVVEIFDGELVVRLLPRASRAGCALAQGYALWMYFAAGSAFTRQPVDVRCVIHEPESVRVRVAPAGPPVPAEARQCYRVSAVAANLKAILGGAEACSVLDVSATGFSVYARSALEPGTPVRAVLVHEEERIPGLVVVQNLRRTRGGRLRCGVRCDDDVHTNGSLVRALPRINAELQRRQLARRSGLAADAGLPLAPRFTARRLAAAPGAPRWHGPSGRRDPHR